MTLDEAIKHAEEVADEKENEGKLLCQSEAASIGCLTCAKEHRQLAEWLKDYKRLLEQQPCDYAISRDMALEKMADYAASGYADSAEDFEEYSRIICQLPPVTPQTGEWIKHPEIETSAPEYLMFYECSECGDKQCFCKSDIHKKRFCNNCGAKMVDPQESEKKE